MVRLRFRLHSECSGTQLVRQTQPSLAKGEGSGMGVAVVDHFPQWGHETLLVPALVWLSTVAGDFGLVSACFGPRMVQAKSGPSRPDMPTKCAIQA